MLSIQNYLGNGGTYLYNVSQQSKMCAVIFDPKSRQLSCKIRKLACKATRDTFGLSPGSQQLFKSRFLPWRDLHTRPECCGEAWVNWGPGQEVMAIARAVRKRSKMINTFNIDPISPLLCFCPGFLALPRDLLLLPRSAAPRTVRPTGQEATSLNRWSS